MKKHMIKIVVLLTIAMMILSSLISTASIPKNEIDGPIKIEEPDVDPNYPSWNGAPDWWSDCEPDSEFSKKVWNNSLGDWDESGSFLLGEEIQFKISFTVNAAGTYQSRWWDVIVADYLPPTVRYVSANIVPDYIIPEVYDDSTTSYYPFTKVAWDLGNLMDGEYVEIIITGQVEYLTKADFGIPELPDNYDINYHTRNVAVMDYDWRSSSCGNYHHYETVNNDAIFTIIQCREPDIEINKYVSCSDPTHPDFRGYLDDSVTSDKMDVTKSPDSILVTFMLEVTNTGNLPLYVIVVDELPLGLSYYGNANPKPDETDGKRITWYIRILQPGQTVYIYFDASIDKCGRHVNYANATGVTSEQAMVYDDDTASVFLPCDPQIGVEKQVWNGCEWAEYAEFSLGEIVQFRLQVSNPNDYWMHFSGYIFDKLPSNLIYVEGSATIEATETIDWGENTVNWTRIESIPPGGLLIFTFNAIAIDCGEGINNATVQAYIVVDEDVPRPLRIPVRGSDTAAVYVECPPDNPEFTLEKLVKWDCTEPFVEQVDAEIDDYVTFKLILENTGDTPLDITLIDTLPIGLTYANNANIEPDSIVGNTLTWYFTDIAPGTTITITFTADVNDCGELINVANATATYEQTTLYQENTAIVNVECPPDNPEFTLEKLVKWDCTEPFVEQVDAEIDDYVTFKLILENTGDTPLDITLIDTLPIGLTYANNANIEPDSIVGNTLTWYFYDVEPGTSIVITFIADVVECGELINIANATGTFEEQIVYNEDSATVNVECPPDNPDISVNKYVKENCNCPYHDDGITVDLGDWVTFKIVVNNTGDIPLDITVMDILPEGLSYNNSATPSEPEISSDGKLYWNFTNVAPGTVIEITFKADTIECGQQENWAYVYGYYDQIEPVEDSDNAFVVVECPPVNPDILLIKYVRKNPCGEYSDIGVTVEAGNDVNFKIVVTNTGDVDLSDVTVCDTLPVGLVYANNAMVDGVPEEPYPSGDNLCWDIGLLLIDQTVEIIFDAVVYEDDCGIFENIATAIGSYDDIVVTDDDNATVTAPCDEEPDVDIEKRVRHYCGGEWTDYLETQLYDKVKFKIVVENTGEIPLDITVVDVLPDNLEYIGDSANYPPDVDGNEFTWIFLGVNPTDSPIEITFNANVTDCGIGDNWGYATTNEQVSDQDNAIVNVICEEEWDKSSIEVTGECIESDAVFTITNTGDPGEGDMDGPSEYRVYRNDVLEDTQNFQLNGGESLIVTIPANGDTIRLEADQRPGHPGNSQSQATVEDCGCDGEDEDPEDDARDRPISGNRIKTFLFKLRESKSFKNLLVKLLNQFPQIKNILSH